MLRTGLSVSRLAWLRVLSTSQAGFFSAPYLNRQPGTSDGDPGQRQQEQHRQQPGDQLVPSSPLTKLELWLSPWTLALRRLLAVVILRGSPAADLFVRSMLEQHLDPFAVDFIALKHPEVLRLSWQNDIEPVLAWLGSKGLRGADAAAVITGCPAVLAKSVDEQLQPLAELVEQMGGCPCAVLLQFPKLVEVPVAHLNATRSVLRQLGATDGEVALLLRRYPDLYAQLATTLRQLFSTYGKLGLRAYIRDQQSQRARAVRRAAYEQQGPAPAGGGQPEVAGSSALLGSGRSDSPRLAVEQQGHFVCDTDIVQGLERVQSALAALAMVAERDEEGESDEHEAALSELQYEIDRLASSEGVCLRQD